MFFNGEDDRICVVEWMAVFKTTGKKNVEDVREEWMNCSDDFILLNFVNECDDHARD